MEARGQKGNKASQLLTFNGPLAKISFISQGDEKHLMAKHDV